MILDIKKLGKVKGGHRKRCSGCRCYAKYCNCGCANMDLSYAKVDYRTMFLNNNDMRSIARGTTYHY